jgi:hypothetical protein
MNHRTLKAMLVFLAVVVGLTSAYGGALDEPRPLSRAASPFPSGGGANTWITNGATACEKYLTSDVFAAILLGPPERPQRLDAHSCHAGIVYIDLEVADYANIHAPVVK